MNEYVVIGLGLGVISIVMIAVFLLCHRKRKRRRLEHPSNAPLSKNHSKSKHIRFLLRILCRKLMFHIYLGFLVLPSHAHFHTCESIGERFATSSSINSVSRRLSIFCFYLESNIFFLRNSMYNIKP